MPGRTVALRSWRAVAFAFALLLSGIVSQPACIFFVGDSGPLQSVRCSFKGETTTTCGMCIASKCQQAVNACCATSSCQGDLGYLDSCASSMDSTACYTLTTGDLFNDSSGSFTTLGDCVQQNCSSQCTGSSSDDGGFVPSPGVSCVNLGAGCSCTATSSTPSSTPACDTTTVVSAGSTGICCAPTDYPGLTGSTCTCAPYACGTDNVGECVCSASPDLIPEGYMPTASCDDSAGGVCCIDNTGFCSCSASLSECSGGTMVFECSPGAGASACPQTETSVGSCSSP